MMLRSRSSSVNVRRQGRIGCGNTPEVVLHLYIRQADALALQRDYRRWLPKDIVGWALRLPARWFVPQKKEKRLCSRSRDRFALDEQAINQTAKRAANQRTEPIDVMIVPKIRCQRRPENARRIHGRTGKRTAK